MPESRQGTTIQIVGGEGVMGARTTQGRGAPLTEEIGGIDRWIANAFQGGVRRDCHGVTPKVAILPTLR